MSAELPTTDTIATAATEPAEHRAAARLRNTSRTSSTTSSASDGGACFTSAAASSRKVLLLLLSNSSTTVTSNTTTLKLNKLHLPPVTTADLSQYQHTPPSLILSPAGSPPSPHSSSKPWLLSSSWYCCWELLVFEGRTDMEMDSGDT
ncbi:hypothetical protein BCV69DRAFT_301856 [Microstroma glucosiphilum]|uniref:Uncharacterized protein n=1 Tax=Pseudomicrostroma glucosiphilum TaxID=1684307 RepID=A0A316TWH9_9BASI|nr:hypothetical protein BCV69DRAFT_301856 [Pseudomicrostroma glucosiphilum]PWN17842.1 hypothetical protein BCV69DRAFT_301856 [Pseudomicrostroma glucosiphilum]